MLGKDGKLSLLKRKSRTDILLADGNADPTAITKANSSNLPGRFLQGNLTL